MLRSYILHCCCVLQDVDEYEKMPTFGVKYARYENILRCPILSLPSSLYNNLFPLYEYPV